MFHEEDLLSFMEEAKTKFQISSQPMDWYRSKAYCQSLHSNLVTKRNIVSVMENSETIEADFWLSSDPKRDQCQSYSVKTGRAVRQNCHVKHLAVCQTQEEIPVAPLQTLPDFIYSCQCKEDFGYENCTEAGDIVNSVNPGATYCLQANDNYVSLSGSDMAIFIDHAVYGRPFFLENSLTNIGEDICLGYHAESNSEYCVASNTLAAMTYWCQGKTDCLVDFDLIVDVTDFRDFFAVQGKD